MLLHWRQDVPWHLLFLHTPEALRPYGFPPAAFGHRGDGDQLITAFGHFLMFPGCSEIFILEILGPFTSYFIYIYLSQEKMLIQLSYFQLFYLFYPVWRLYACMCLFCLWVNPCVHSLIVDKWIRLIWFDVLWDGQDKVKTPDTV